MAGRRKKYFREDDALRPVDMNMGHEVDPHVYDDEPEGGDDFGTPIDKDEELNKKPMTRLETKSGAILAITEKLSKLSPSVVKEIAARIREEEDCDKDEKDDDEDMKSESRGYRYPRFVREEDEDDDHHDHDDEDGETQDEYAQEESYYSRRRPIREDEEDDEEHRDHDDDDEDEDVKEAAYSSRLSRRARYEDFEGDEMPVEREAGDEPEPDEDWPEEPGHEYEKPEVRVESTEDDDDHGYTYVDDGDDDDEEDRKDVKEQIKRLRKESLKTRYNVGNLFEGHDLSPAFKRKAEEAFNTAVLAGVKDNLKIISENEIRSRKRFRTKLREDMVRKIDQYLTYVAEEFIKENRLAIENGLKVEITESFMRGMKDLFETHYVEVPARKRNLFDELSEQLERTNQKLTKQISKAVSLREENELLRREHAVNKIGAGLTRTQRDRLSTLSEGVDYTNAAQFEAKLTELTKTFILSEGDSTSRYSTSFAPMISEGVASTVEDTDENQGGDPYVAAATKVLKSGY